MTSVPKPLKFLRPQYDGLKATFAACGDGDNKRLLADIVSLLAMTRTSEPDVMPESLQFRLAGSKEEIGSWGHEVRAAARAAPPTLGRPPACALLHASIAPADATPRARPHLQYVRNLAGEIAHEYARRQEADGARN